MIDKDKILSQFGMRLKQARLNSNMSQEEMALSIGFDRTYISILERGKRNPSLFTICKIADLLNINPKDLV